MASAARSLIGKVDVIYTNTDNNVVSAYESLVKVGNDAKIPLVASDTDSVKRGGIAALGINYRDLGVQTGKVVVRILKGEKPGAIASETSSKLELYVNPGAAAKQASRCPRAVAAAGRTRALARAGRRIGLPGRPCALWQKTGENRRWGNVRCKSSGKTYPETQEVRRFNSLICSFLI